MPTVRRPRNVLPLQSNAPDGKAPRHEPDDDPQYYQYQPYPYPQPQSQFQLEPSPTDANQGVDANAAGRARVF